MASMGIELPSTFGRKVRRTAIAAALAVATSLTITGVMIGTSADAQVKKSCPKKIAAACKKNHKHVCVTNDKNGCCTKWECQPN